MLLDHLKYSQIDVPKGPTFKARILDENGNVIHETRVGYAWPPSPEFFKELQHRYPDPGTRIELLRETKVVEVSDPFKLHECE